MISVVEIPWLAAFPALAAIEDSAWLQAARQARVYRLSAHRRLFADHDLNRNFVLIVDGRIGLIKAVGGREVTLYRLGRGDICLFNAIAQLTGSVPYPVTGVTETDVEIASIPSDLFRGAFAESPALRQYVLQACARCMTDIMELLEGIVFERLDVRLAKLLLAQAGGDPEGHFCITHQELANRLGSSREVVSRLLQEFERKGWIDLARGEIRLRAENDLRHFVQHYLPTHKSRR